MKPSPAAARVLRDSLTFSLRHLPPPPTLPISGIVLRPAGPGNPQGVGSPSSLEPFPVP